MSFFEELRRRNVLPIGVAYLVVLWLLIEVGRIILPAFGAPPWAMRAFSVLLILGFPIALVLAWGYKLTPDGINADNSNSKSRGSKLDFIIIGGLAIAVVLSTYDVLMWDKSGSPRLGVEDRNSIAVLPFVSVSTDESDAIFAAGIQQDIVNQLGNIPTVRVASSTSAMDYRGTTKNVRTIGEELGVATLLEGTVRRAGDQVRITVQLIDTKTDEHLWAESFNRELAGSDIFQIQEEIARSIADTLKLATDDPKFSLEGEFDCQSLGITDTECADYDSIIDGLNSATIAYNRPQTMMLNKPIDISLALGFAKDSRPESAVEDLPGETVRAKTRITRQMSAELQGATFEITPEGPQRRVITRAAETQWMWRVKPLEQGRNKQITLSVYIHIEDAGQITAPITIRTFRDRIFVKVSVWDKVTRFVKEKINPIYAAIGAIASVVGGAWAFFVWWKKKEWRLK